MRVAIIGAGMAGLACGERLSAGGHAVTVFDKGRAVGGRMSTRRVATVGGEAGFDHGAQYFNARAPGFQARVQRWGAAGLAAPWLAAGADAWVGTPGMRAPLEHMARRLDVRSGCRIDGLARDGGWRLLGATWADDPYDILVVAIPAEQAAVLLAGWDAPIAALARGTPSQPCWTVMAAFTERLPLDADILRDRGAVGWAARNSAKPGRTGPEAWVIQAGPEWSAAHSEDQPDAVLAALLGEFALCAGTALPPRLTATAHRWRYARSGGASSEAAPEGMIWRSDLGLGVCGDWLLGPRVESAWLSGDGLAAAVELCHAVEDT